MTGACRLLFPSCRLIVQVVFGPISLVWFPRLPGLSTDKFRIADHPSSLGLSTSMKACENQCRLTEVSE